MIILNIRDSPVLQPQIEFQYKWVIHDIVTYYHFKVSIWIITFCFSQYKQKVPIDSFP